MIDGGNQFVTASGAAQVSADEGGRFFAPANVVRRDSFIPPMTAPSAAPAAPADPVDPKGPDPVTAALLGILEGTKQGPLTVPVSGVTRISAGGETSSGGGSAALPLVLLLVAAGGVFWFLHHKGGKGIHLPHAHGGTTHVESSH